MSQAKSHPGFFFQPRPFRLGGVRKENPDFLRKLLNWLLFYSTIQRVGNGFYLSQLVGSFPSLFTYRQLTLLQSTQSGITTLCYYPLILAQRVYKEGLLVSIKERRASKMRAMILIEVLPESFN